jgi:hypothetical protein
MDHEYRASVLASEIGVSDGHKTPSELRRAIRERLAAIKAEREEDDVALQVVRVRLGGEEREVRLLPMSRDREWRRRLGALIADAVRAMKIDSDDVDVGSVVAYALGDGLDGVVDLFFLYTGFDRDEVMETATSLQVYKAAMEIFEVFAVPFVAHLLPAMMRIRTLA